MLIILKMCDTFLENSCANRAQTSESFTVCSVWLPCRTESHLDIPLKTVFQVSARRVVREQCEPGLRWLPHSCVLVQSVQKFFHRGGRVEPNYLARGSETLNENHTHRRAWGKQGPRDA